MSPVDEKEVERKIQAGEDLSDEETEFVMNYPNEGESYSDAEGAEEEGAFDDVEDEKDGSGPDKKTEQKKDDGSDPEKKIEEKPADSDKKPKPDESDEGKDKTPTSEKKPEVTETLHEKLERELAKPEGSEDLSDFTEREKGLYSAMRRERKRAQAAEADRDAERFQRIKERKEREETAKVAAANKAAEEEIEKILEGKDGEDVITVDQMKSIIGKLKTKPATREGSDVTAEEAANMASARENFLATAELNARDIVTMRREKDSSLPDFDKVIEAGEAIVKGNKDYQQQIAKAYLEKRNIVLLTYELVSKDPAFTALYKPGTAAAKKEDPPKDDQANKDLQKINENQEKPKTSGAEGGGGGKVYKSKEGKEYKVADLVKMPPSEFRKVPKEVRDEFLKTF